MLGSVGTVEQVYTTLFAVSGLISIAAIPRARQFDDPDVRRGLVGLLATAGGWALLKTAFFLLSDYREPVYIVGLALGFATVWAWLYFCSAYTGRRYHRNKSLRRLGAGVFLFVVSVKATNRVHGLYFTTEEVETPFAYLAIEHNLFHWAATGLSYVLAAVGMFMLFQLYFESGYETRSLTVLTGLIGVPVVLDVAALFTPWLVDVIYAPLGVAAFAVGVLFLSERRFLAVQETSRGDGLSIYLDENGRIKDYSAGASDVLPELSAATGSQFSTAVPTVAEAIDSDDNILEREHDGEQRFYFVSASTVSLGESGTEVVQLSDVTKTERQRREIADREQALDEQNELYRAVIDASFAFVFRIDLDGTYMFVSPSVEEFLGYSPGELEGQQINVTLPDERTAERAWDQIEPVLHGEQNRVRDFPLKTKAGRTVYSDIRGVPIYDGSVPEDERGPDDIVGIQLMVRDATERRQREGLISVINRVLRHNLRNRMSVITSYASMLESTLDDDDAEKATHIQDTADRVLDLTESAQKIEENRELSPDLEPMDVVSMVDRTVSELEVRYPEASITADTPESAVANTHGRFETALSEVADNAAKHGGDPPIVDIEVTVTESQVAISVSDNGPGIPEMEREVLQSSTETQLVHGDGLGLWLVFWIVTSLKGELEATVSDGSTVTIWLPRPS
ncbi:ATP-binding protein [Halovenus salina]|uniref:ATP-binding protein n=1 Tax=Halovenus salina TaxID=1510225 RepID=A0ABD5W9Z7_9EURY|nr:ATP-binding protein [Halovenus salina]